MMLISGAGILYIRDQALNEISGLLQRLFFLTVRLVLPVSKQVIL